MSRSRKKITAGLTSKSSAADVNAVQDYLKRFGYLGRLRQATSATSAPPQFPLGDGDDAGRRSQAG